MNILVTCEHGGNDIPKKFRQLFFDAQEVLQTHRGYDLGALSISQMLAHGLQSRLFSSTTSRLLIDLNRSLGHAEIFSKWSKCLNKCERESLIQSYYRAYRDEVESYICSLVIQAPVLHVSVHSFTPVFNGMPRKTDIGLLFDPERQFEKEISREWQAALQTKLPSQNIHFNLPYHGTSDGFTTYLRTRFADGNYAGIELEVNQKHLADNQLCANVAEILLSTIPSAYKALIPATDQPASDEHQSGDRAEIG